MAIVTHDLDASERFYVGVLGLPVLVRYEDEAGKHRSTWLGLDGCFLAWSAPPLEVSPDRMKRPAFTVWRCESRQTIAPPGVATSPAQASGSSASRGFRCICAIRTACSSA